MINIKIFKNFDGNDIKSRKFYFFFFSNQWWVTRKKFNLKTLNVAKPSGSYAVKIAK